MEPANLELKQGDEHKNEYMYRYAITKLAVELGVHATGATADTVRQTAVTYVRSQQSRLETSKFMFFFDANYAGGFKADIDAFVSDLVLSQNTDLISSWTDIQTLAKTVYVFVCSLIFPVAASNFTFRTAHRPVKGPKFTFGKKRARTT